MPPSPSRSDRGRRAQRVAVGLPADLLRQVERRRRESGETRSGFVRHAVEDFIRRAEHERRVAEYVESYRARPETPEEIAEAQAIAAEVLGPGLDA